MADTLVQEVYTIVNPIAEITAGVLCVIAKPNKEIGTQVIVGSDECLGAGISFKNNSSNMYSIIVNGQEYRFTPNGAPDTRNAHGWWLYLASATKSPMGVGSVQGDLTKKVTTRGADGEAETVSTTEKMSVSIDNLNARDQFALKVLQSLLTHVDNPAALSTDQMSYYCDSAYRWASYLMATAATTRTIVENEEGSSSSEAVVSTEDLVSNTDKLLNNLIVELAKTDLVETNEDSSQTISKHVTLKQLPELIEAVEALKDDASLTSVTSAIGELKTDTVKVLKDINRALRDINVTVTYTE